MRILIAQINPTIGDLEGNTKRIIAAIDKGRQEKAQLVLFPEMTLSGYPPEDFLLLPHFIHTIDIYLDRIVKASQGLVVVVGLPRYNPAAGGEKVLYNSAAIIQDKKLLGFYDKILLPTYDVFDERRYFEPGTSANIWDILGKRVAITICEDIWQHSGFVSATSYLRDPVNEYKPQRPDILLNLSASPYSTTKFDIRLQVSLNAAKTLGCPVILCNQVGGNDSLIFDGYSLYVRPEGHVKCAKGFAEDTLLIDTDRMERPVNVSRNDISDLYDALVLGVRDYFTKLGFQKACLGLSGGIDSALVACIAAEALGKDHVLALSLPSRYSSPEGRHDAEQLSTRLGLEFQEIPIEAPFETYLQLLEPRFQNRASDATEENLQARIRGMILMAYSNKFGYLVLSTGNKSELAMGYSTLYGDMCGGLAVISDLTKQQVYALARWINRNGEIIPQSTIDKAPSAELRPNQKDTDSLPPYEIVDQVLQAYVEQHLSSKEISEKFNFPLDVVEDLVKRIHRNEYKRRQSPPGLRVSEKAFSVGRRFPIVQRWI